MAELKRLFEILDINPALLDNPNNREKGVEELLSKARELANSAVRADVSLNSGFELWGEALTNSTVIAKLKDACNTVKNEFSNYQAKFNTVAKLNNFSLSMDQIDELASKIEMMRKISQFVDFKSGCADNVNYIANIEYVDLGAVLKSEIDNAKADFRCTRDSIMNGVSGIAAAQKVDNILSSLKSKYIDLYFDAHKRTRLNHDGAKRRVSIQEGTKLANLRKLRSIEILSAAKLTDIETEMSNIKVCYELTPEELKSNHICPHCRYNLDDKVNNVNGMVDNLEIRIDNLLAEWTKTLLDTISDPLVADQKRFLSTEQQNVINEFIDRGGLPQRVDDFFVKAVNDLLKGFEQVAIDSSEFVAKLEQMPPMDEATFKSKVNELITSYTKGKDASKLRIIVKRKESEI